ncbi:MAG: polysaccharide deacetylase family protein [Pseudonocardia sp.]
MPERRYVLDVVLADRLGLPWRLETCSEIRGAPEVRITRDGAADGRAVVLPDVLLAVADEAWLTATSLPRGPLPRLPVGALGEGTPLGERIPALWSRPGAGCAGDAGPEGVTLHVDVLGTVFALLTRYEELADGPRDSYDRFPAARSVAGREGLLGVPLADLCVELLWAALQRTWPDLRRRPTSYDVLLSHDVDEPLSTLGRGPRLLARQFAGDVVHRRDAGLVLRRARAVADARRGRFDRDPHATFDFLCDVSERHGLRSAFYFLAANDVHDDLLGHPWVQRLIGHVHERGHEVGLHAGFGTYRDGGRTAAEFCRLRALAEAQGVDQPRWGGRQHYLQWVNPDTWRHWDDAGLDYECTLAFSEIAGFRTGTCHPYRAFDLLRRRPLRLVEQPFQVMDVTLFGYLALRPDAARETILDVARQCRRFGGTLGLLWHNDEVLRTAHQRRWYAETVAAIAP